MAVRRGASTSSAGLDAEEVVEKFGNERSIERLASTLVRRRRVYEEGEDGLPLHAGVT